MTLVSAICVMNGRQTRHLRRSVKPQYRVDEIVFDGMFDKHVRRNALAEKVVSNTLDAGVQLFYTNYFALVSARSCADEDCCQADCSQRRMCTSSAPKPTESSTISLKIALSRFGPRLICPSEEVKLWNSSNVMTPSPSVSAILKRSSILIRHACLVCVQRRHRLPR
jgi:hypothetical protein